MYIFQGDGWLFGVLWRIGSILINRMMHLEDKMLRKRTIDLLKLPISKIIYKTDVLLRHLVATSCDCNFFRWPAVKLLIEFCIICFNCLSPGCMKKNCWTKRRKSHSVFLGQHICFIVKEDYLLHLLGFTFLVWETLFRQNTVFFFFLNMVSQSSFE